MKRLMLSVRWLKVTLISSFLLALIFTSCSKDDDPDPVVVDKAVLQDSIAVANDLHDNTVEGTKPGQYEAGSKAALQAAIDAAQAIHDDAASTQSEVNSAVANLHAAMDQYRSHYITEIEADALLGFWKFNGNTADSSGKGNNGEAKVGHAYYGAGTLQLTTDRFDRADMAYMFDKGANVEIPYSPALNPQQMTVSMWSNKSGVARALNPDTYTMMSLNRWNGWKLQYQVANKIFYTVKGVSGTDTAYYDRDDEVAVLDNDTWYHVAVTFKPGEMNFYINGDLVKSYTNTPNPAITLASPVNLVIGQDLPTDRYTTTEGDFYVNWGGFFTGKLDDVMYYNIALTGPQIKSIYNNQATQ